MTDYLFAVVLIVIWVSLGLAAVLMFISRHGRHHAGWYAVGVVLGPIFLPIAAEMGGRRERLSTWTGTPAARDDRGTDRLTVLAAVDGSTESDLAVRDVAQVAAPGSRVHLLTVLDPDDASPEDLAAAEERLRERTAWLTNGPASVSCQVASGDPVEVILEYAARHRVDLIVAGRRGHGLSPRLLGSVADRLVRQSPRAVLLGAMVSSGQHRAE